MRLLDTVEGQPILELSNSTVVFLGRGRIDNDGTSQGDDADNFHLPETTLKYKGKSLNAYKIPFIVAHPSIVKKTKGVVMGSQAYVTNLIPGHPNYGTTVAAVVGDEGPEKRLGEVSVELAKRLGLNPDPNRGGEDRPLIGYEILVGVGATVDSVLYDLQSS